MFEKFKVEQADQELCKIIMGQKFVASIVDEFKTKLSEMIDQGIKKINIDFSNVDIIDSLGIGALVYIFNQLEQKGGELSITNSSEALKKLFKSMNLDKRFKILPCAGETA